jgi:methylglutamate dehydrogenase subunit B
MRLTCPLCGERDHSEFTYLGDATVKRPDPDAPDAAAAFHAYVHLRKNPAGWHHEFWYHASGCRAWIVVERNTLTHELRGSQLASRFGRDLEPPSVVPFAGHGDASDDSGDGVVIDRDDRPEGAEQ